MQVKCRCGQTFMVHANRFPHEMHCHACGVRFMANENGSTEEIHAQTLPIVCRCGRQFVVNAVQFPRPLHCGRCDRRFNVLDTGETIDVEQVTPALEADAYYVEAEHRIIDRVSPRVPLSLCDELERIDARWRLDRSLFALGRINGVAIMPSAFLSVVVGLGGIGLCLTLMTLAANLLGPGKGSETAILWIALGLISMVVACYIRTEAISLEHAESAWRRQREEVLSTWTTDGAMRAPRKDDGSFRSVRSLL